MKIMNTPAFGFKKKLFRFFHDLFSLFLIAKVQFWPNPKRIILFFYTLQWWVFWIKLKGLQKATSYSIVSFHMEKPPVSRQLSLIFLYSHSPFLYILALLLPLRCFFHVKILTGHNSAYPAAQPLKELSSVLPGLLVWPLHKAVSVSVTTYCCPVKKCICAAQVPFENKTHSLSDSNKTIRDQPPPLHGAPII